MRRMFHRTIASIFGHNLQSTPADVIVDQLNEPRPLPMGRKDFDEWSERIVSGALLPHGPDEDESIFLDSQKGALASMIMHLGPTESHKPDAFFVHSLRKAAVNQVAHAVFQELHKKAKDRLAQKDADDRLEIQRQAATEAPN